MIHTYQAVDGHARPRADHASMAAASAALPAGAYTTFRTYHGRRVLRLSQHLRRLEESAALLSSVPPVAIADDSARLSIADAVRAAGHAESRLRLTYAPPSLYISVERFDALPASAFEEGVSCATVVMHRANPHAKSTTFIAQAEQARTTLPADVNEGLMIDRDGAVLEGLSSNFFALLDGELRTEGARVLSGVTRAIVLEVASGMVPVSLRAVQQDDLARISEAFLTSVSREILPLVRIDGRPVGDGAPGPVTRALIQAFSRLVAREATPLW
jgi:branched-chain amino acid aminotransferase